MPPLDARAMAYSATNRGLKIVLSQLSRDPMQRLFLLRPSERRAAVVECGRFFDNDARTTDRQSAIRNTGAV